MSDDDALHVIREAERIVRAAGWDLQEQVVLERLAGTRGLACARLEPRSEVIQLVAYDGEPRTEDALAGLAGDRQRQFKLRYSLVDLVKERRRIERSGPGIDPAAKTLTDDFAPVEALKAMERHNRQWPSLSPQ